MPHSLGVHGQYSKHTYSCACEERTLISNVELVAGTLLVACDDTMKGTSEAMAQAPPRQESLHPSSTGNTQDLQSMIKAWPAKPKEQVLLMQKTYGEPEIISEHLIVWKNTGPFKFTKIMDKEIPHDFPVVHTDFMEQGLDLKVPADKVGPLAEYDGSVIVDRTKGCISARCDVQAHNTLALNLAHDIISGKRSPAEARNEFAMTVAKEKAGKSDPYLEKLQFSSEGGDAGDKDMPVKAMDMSKEETR